jgi:acyl carrier protein
VSARDVADLRRALIESLQEVAPELDPAALRTDRPLRQQLDIDSFDFLRVLEALQRRTGIEVPEAAYPAFDTLDGALAWLVGQD